MKQCPAEQVSDWCRILLNTLICHAAGPLRRYSTFV
uniref:Uncharacterized protein n=1 Tax=Anguilla anguilla TaxID=7936 RepID=A0A0E9R3L3_ANGAN